MPQQKQFNVEEYLPSPSDETCKVFVAHQPTTHTPGTTGTLSLSLFTLSQELSDIFPPSLIPTEIEIYTGNICWGNCLPLCPPFPEDCQASWRAKTKAQWQITKRKIYCFDTKDENLIWNLMLRGKLMKNTRERRFGIPATCNPYTASLVR